MAVLSKYKHAQDVTKLQETVDPVTVWISVVIVIKSNGMFHLMQFLSGLLLLLLSIPLSNGVDYTYEIDCSNLRMGQYICPHPDYDFIDPKTQQPKGCTKENKAKGM